MLMAGQPPMRTGGPKWPLWHSPWPSSSPSQLSHQFTFGIAGWRMAQSSCGVTARHHRSPSWVCFATRMCTSDTPWRKQALRFLGFGLHGEFARGDGFTSTRTPKPGTAEGESAVCLTAQRASSNHIC